MGAGDTIFALSSASGKAGVAVVRVSGAGAFASLEKICGIKNPAPRTALLRPLKNPKDGGVIDHALILPFKGPSSFTGEDVVEYQLHGSRAVLDALFSVLGSCDGHRLALPGEFTRRGFENGRMDLTGAEAIADLINAETELQRQQALLQMDGALSSLYEGWREKLVRAMAYVEAVIDFPDEEIPDSETAKVKPDIEKLLGEIDAHLNDNRRGERLRDGIRIAIVGAPNAGKSSLLNALAKRDVAIVSPMAGTTRDVIEAHLDLGGYPVIIADTAGLRPDEITDDGAHGSVESEGIRRAMERAKDADFKLLLFDGMQSEPDKHTLSLLDDNSIIVFTKLDETKTSRVMEGHDCVSISSVTGENMDALLNLLNQKIASLYALSRETPSLTRVRHRSALEECAQRLKESLHADMPELMAEDIRMAARALGRITGRVDVEDLLDVIFRDFCIGK